MFGRPNEHPWITDAERAHIQDGAAIALGAAGVASRLAAAARPIARRGRS